MKQILFILHLPPPIHGAAIVGEMVKNNKSINASFHCRFINLSTSIKVDEIGRGGFSKLKRYLGILWRTFSHIRKSRPDLVYLTLSTTGLGFYKDAVVALLIKAFKIPLVYHFHNKGVKTRQHRRFDNLIYRKILGNVDIILLSKYLYPDIEKYVPQDRVHYCPNGIPATDVAPTVKYLGQKDCPVNILFLSNLIASKGVWTLLDVCNRLVQQGLNFKCTYIGGEGDISERQFREEIKSLCLDEFVCYAGRRFGHEKELAYLEADIFVLPTAYSNECFPLVLLEAMQFALPIISTTEGGISDIVQQGETGFLVDSQNVDKIVANLALLIKDSELRIRMGEKGRKLFLQKFTQPHFERRLTKILNELVEKND